MLTATTRSQTANRPQAADPHFSPGVYYGRRIAASVLLEVAQLRLRRPIRDKPSGYLRFAALATKSGEKSGLTP
jgi:hypothetical protein